MNNQALLNSLPLNEASVRISDELISKKRDLETTRYRLMEDRKRYEADYVRAYEDGDVRENEPLKAATQSLKLVTGEMALNADVLRRMEGLEDVQFLVGTYNFGILEQTIHEANSELRNLMLQQAGVTSIEEVGPALQRVSPYDISQMIIQMANLVKSTGEVEKDVDCLRALNDYWEVARKPAYNTCGIIVLYTTVRLCMNGQMMTYRIYPNGVSFIDIGVMAANARVARAILGKEKGQSISIRHDSNNTVLTYEIVDIY